MAGSKWDEKCSREGCPSDDHKPVWNKKRGDYIERCSRCQAHWKRIEVETLRDPRQGRRSSSKDELVLQFHRLDRTLRKEPPGPYDPDGAEITYRRDPRLAPAELGIYVAYVCHPGRRSGADSALDWMEKNGIQVVFNRPSMNWIEDWIGTRRREVEKILRDAKMWNDRAA